MTHFECFREISICGASPKPDSSARLKQTTYRFILPRSTGLIFWFTFYNVSMKTHRGGGGGSLYKAHLRDLLFFLFSIWITSKQLKWRDAVKQTYKTVLLDIRVWWERRAEYAQVETVLSLRNTSLHIGDSAVTPCSHRLQQQRVREHATSGNSRSGNMQQRETQLGETRDSASGKILRWRHGSAQKMGHDQINQTSSELRPERAADDSLVYKEWTTFKSDLDRSYALEKESIQLHQWPLTGKSTSDKYCVLDAWFSSDPAL